MSLLRRRASEEGDDSNPLHDATWLYSFADLMTQLLIFAILMVSVIGVKMMPPDQQQKQRELQETVAEIEKFIKDSRLSESMAVDRAADRLVIRMKSAILFDEGKADLTAGARQVLAGMAPLLAKAPSLLRVEGHTDNVPIRSAAYPSNWELSTNRAISVVRYLEERRIDPARLSVAGYGEHHPIIKNDSAEHRAMNRRVEIVVLGG